MSESTHDNILTNSGKVVRKHSRKTTGTADGHQSVRIGDKIIRIDASSIIAPTHPHLNPDEYQNDAQATLSQVVPTISEALSQQIVTIGLGDVVANNQAMQQAAAEMADTQISPEGQEARVLNIKPAWEVDYFRWPRLARRLLETHPTLFDTIGNQILEDLDPTRSRIGICSTFPREGKTTLSICVARWAANQGYRTLLIDADVERPQLTTMSGMDCAFGWQSILYSNLPMSETMIRSAENGLVFMPLQTNRKSLIVEKLLDRLSMITFQMKYEFDVVVIDMGNIDNICVHGTDSMDLVDAMLVARDPSRTSVGQMMDTRRVLGNLGMTRTYVARNFAKDEAA